MAKIQNPTKVITGVNTRCGLNNLQKLRDGEPLGGKSRAEDDFAFDEEDFLD